MRSHRLRLSHHIGYGVLKLVLGAGSIMPLSVMRGLGTAVTAMAFRLGGRDLKRATQHLGIAFPNLDTAERQTLLRDTARHLGRLVGEVAWLMHASSDDVNGLCDIEGTEHVDKATSDGRGAVLITAHTGNWEIMNARLGTAGIPMSIAVREVYDPRLDTIATRLRSRFGAEVIHRGATSGRRLAKALTGNRVAGLLIDQDIADISGVFVPFFGRPAWTPCGGAVLALKGRCPTIPAFSHRKADGRHLVTIHEPLTEPETRDFRNRITELTAASTAAIEQQIKQHPEQWVWMHRRWRTQPATEA